MFGQGKKCTAAGYLSPASPRSAAARVFFGVQSLDESSPAFRKGVKHQPLERLSDCFADTLNDYVPMLCHAGVIARWLYGSGQKLDPPRAKHFELCLNRAAVI